MKFCKINIVLISFIAFLFLTSCASSKTKEPRQMDDTFLADLEDFDLGEISIQTSLNKNQPKVTQVSIQCTPRSNTIKFYFKLGMDTMGINFTYNERMALNQVFDEYITQINEGRLENRKPTKKNAYSIGNFTVAWGVLGLTHYVDTTYYTNYKFVEERKPYFIIQAESSVERTESGQNYNSPTFTIYLSPAQIQKLREICSQQKLVDYVNSVYTDAYDFYIENDEVINEPVTYFDDEVEDVLEDDSSDEYIDAK